MEEYRKTCRRINQPGDAHALTFSCFRRQKFLVSERTRNWMVQAIERAGLKHQFDVWAYVIMPEHVHLLIWPRTKIYSVSTILKSIKQSVSVPALAYVRRHTPGFLPRMEDLQPNGDVHYRFWQRGGGYDQNTIEPQAVSNLIDYIHANPVRRGLCERPTDWIWSSAIEYEQPGRGLLRVNRESLPTLYE